MSESNDNKGSGLRHRRWAGVLALGVVASLVAGGLVVVRPRIDGWAHAYLETTLSEALGGRVALGSVEVDPVRLGVTFRGLTAEATALDGSRFSARISSGSVRLAWSGLPALPAGRLHLSKIALNEPIISIDQGFLDSIHGNVAGERRTVDWRLDRVSIQSGSLTYGNGHIPLDVDATDVQISSEWSIFRHALIGRTSFVIEVATPVLTESLVVRTGSGFRLRGSRLELFELEVDSAAITGTGIEGHVTFEPGIPTSLRGRADVDLSQLARWARSDTISVVGRLSGEWAADAIDGAVRVTGGVASPELSVGPVRMEEARARVVYLPGVARIEDLSAKALGGEITGSAELTVAQPTRVAFDLSGRDVDLGRVLELTDAPFAVASRGDVSLRFDGVPSDPSTWSGAGTVRAEAVEDLAGRLPAAIDAEITMVDGEFVVEGASITAADAVVDLSVALSLDTDPVAGEIRARGTTASASRTHTRLVDLLGSVEVSVPEILRRPVHGAGEVEALATLGETPELDLKLRLVDGSWADWTFANGELDGSLRSGELEIRRAEVHGEDWQIGLEGRFDVLDRSVLVLDGRLSNVDLSPLGELLEVPLQLEGHVDGHVAVAEGPSGLEGGGRISIRELHLEGEPLGTLVSTFVAHRNRVELTDFRLQGPGLHARGDALFDRATGEIDGHLREARVTLSELSVLRRRGIDAHGDAVVSGTVQYSAEGVLGELEITGPDLEVEGFGLGLVRGDLQFRPEGVDFHIATGREHGLSLEGRVEWDEGLPLTAVFYSDQTEIEMPHRGMDAGLWTRLSGHVLVEGPLLHPEQISARGEIERAEIQVGAHELSTTAAVPLRLVDGKASLGPVEWEGPRTHLTTNVEIDLSRGRLSGALNGVVDLAALASLWPKIRAAGPVELETTFEGPWDEIELTGTASVEDGRVRMVGFADSLNAVELRARIDDGQIVVDEMRAMLGGGEIRGAGHATLDGLVVEDYEMRFEVANARVRHAPYFHGAYAGSLELAGTTAQATLSGDLTMLRGLYSREFKFGGLLGPRKREYAAGGRVDIPVTIFLDVNLRGNGDVWVRNAMADLESAVDLHFGGEIRRPEITGRVWVVEGGEVRYRGVEYRIQSGSFDLLDVQRVNPYVDLRAETDVRGYDIFLHVQGTLDRLEYRLSSDPSLSPQDIIALMTTGQTLETLSTTQDEFSDAFTGDVVGNYFAGALTQPFERKLEKLLRLQQVRVDPLLVEGEADATTRVTLGKEVTDDVLVIYSTDINKTDNDIYRVQWKATRRLRLSLESGTSGGIASDLRYTKRFWFNSPEPSEVSSEQATPAVLDPDPEAHDGQRVGRIRIEGVPHEGLLERLPFSPGDPYSRSAMLEGAQQLRRFYGQQGRIEAVVTGDVGSVDPSEQEVEVVYHIEPGIPVEVVLEGGGKRDHKRLRRRLQALWVDTIFQEDLYLDAAELILDYYKERGFFAADVVQHDAVVDGVKIVRFVVDRGAPVRVSEIVLEGVASVSEERVRRQMLTRETRDLVPQVLQDDVGAIHNLYLEHGFLEVEIDRPRIRLSIEGQHASVTLRIREGPPFEIGDLSFPEGLPFSDSDLASWSGLGPGEVFSPGGLVEAEGALRAEIDRRGYPDARIGSILSVDDHDVDIAFEIAPGDLKRVGAIEITGMHKTKRRIVERELLLDVGDLISRDNLLQMQHRLYQLGIFRSVRISIEPMGGEDGDTSWRRVSIAVEDSAPVRFIGGFGYDTETGVRGSFSLSHSNVRGSARRMAIQGGASQINQRIEWIGEDPRLFGRRDLQGLVDVSWADGEEVSFDERRFSTAARIAHKLNDRWAHFIRYNYQSVDISRVRVGIPVGVQDLNLGNLGYGVLRTTRDDPFSPSRGTYTTAEVRVFAPAFLSDASFTRLFIRSSGVLTFRNKMQFASAGRLGLEWTFGDTPGVPITERFFTGGSDSMRGFARDTVGPKDPVTLDPLGGQALIVLNEEFRYPIWRALQGSVFVDIGNVYLTVRDLDLSDLRYDVGLGIRLQTPVGPVRVEYGRKIDPLPGESSGELFLSIGNGF